MKQNLSVLGIIASIFLISCTPAAHNDGGIQETIIEFEHSELIIPIGGSSTLTLIVSPKEKISEVEVQVSDPSIVSLEGGATEEESSLVIQLKSNGIGSTTIVAVCDDRIAKCTVKVDPIAVTGISLDKTSLSLPVYGTEIISATILPENATNPSIIWSSEDDEVAKVSNGVVTAVAPGKTKIIAKASDCIASCDVEVVTIEAESLAFDCLEKEITEKESFIINATILPENTTYKSLTWTLSEEGVVSYELIDADESDNILSAKITALKPGNVTLSAKIGSCQATCEVKVNPAEIPLAAPKIGDYFYSDGTWSDGGLISIKKDGTSPVWADVKPAPIQGKTVIGIVFQTDPDRLSQEEKDNGHTNGLVMCTRLAHAPDASLTMYSLDESISCIGNHKLGTSWYSDLFGYRWTQTILQTYMGRITQCPAFDWVTTDFSPAAPSNTSDWFIPSIGQVWDMMANLGGEEIAVHLKNLRSYEYDITYGMDTKLSYDPIAKLNSCMSAVPAEQKEDFVISRPYSGYGICELMSSTLYDNSDGVCCIFWLGTNGEFEPSASWVNDAIVCRPVLAF